MSPRRGARSPVPAALFLLGGVIGVPGAVQGQVAGTGIQATATPGQLVVTAGETSAPVTLRVVASEPSRESRTFAFAVQPPPALAGHVQGDPPRVSVTLAPGQTEAMATLRFITGTGAPEGTHAVVLTAGTAGPSTQVALVIQRASGELQVELMPRRIEICQGTEVGRGTIQLRGTGGYRGSPALSWSVPPGLAVNPATLRSVPLPPDQQIPFEVSAPGAAPGTYPVTVAAVDPATGRRLEARTEVVVEAAGFTPRAAPAGLSLRQGGPDEALVITLDAGRCFGTQPARVDVTEVPAGLLVSPASGLLSGAGARAVFRVRAPPTVATGRQTMGIQVVQAGPTGEVRRELRVPVVIEAAGPAELARAPRIERISPPELEPGTQVTLELTGQNLGPGVILSFEPAGIQPVAPPVFHSSTRATVQVYVPQGTQEGVRIALARSATGQTEGPGEVMVVAADRAPPEPVEPADEPAPDPPEDEPEDAPVEDPVDVQRLDFGGFIVAVTQAHAPDPESFGGQGVLEEFVFAARLQTVTIGFDFQDLSLVPTTTEGLFQVASGEALFDKAVNLSVPTDVAGLGVQLQRMVLDPEGARIDGRVFLPFTDHSEPSTDILMDLGGDAPDGPLLDGFQVIPSLDLGGLIPLSGGGSVLSFHGTPINDGPWFEALITEAVAPTPTDPLEGLVIAALPTAPTGSVLFTDQPLGPDGDFLYTGIAGIDSHPIGQTGVAFRAQQGLQVVIDLSRSENASQAALNSAYLAWAVPDDEPQGMVIGGMNFAEAASPPPVPHTSPHWMGVLFLDADLDANGIGMSRVTSHVAWVAPGFQTLLASSFGQATGTTTAHGWDVELLNAALGIRNSVLMDAGALGNVHLPFFNETMRVILKMTNGGSPHMEAAAPVWRHYGHSVVIGEGPGFFWDGGALKLGFTDAYWAFNGDLEAPAPQAPQPGLGHPFQDVGAFAVEGFQGSLDFLKENYQHKFHLRFLTMTSGGSTDLLGTTQRSLASVPSLDFLNYPFLSGGAWILLEQQGSAYTLGLRGNLELAGNLGGVTATTRYRVQNGQEQEWTFQGSLKADVNVVNLELDVAGEVDLVTRDVFFHAHGGFTIEEMFNFEADGAFGRQGSTRYWFLQASVDLQGTPIVETGFVSFYSFKGGMAHNLQATASGPCGILDPASFAQNANQCVDPSATWTFMAGTVLAPSEAYGGAQTVHVDGTLVISSQGSLDILGRAWMMRTFEQGYSANSSPQAAAHIGINKDRFVMTACVGPSGSSQGAPASAQTISCEGLDPLRYPPAVNVVEIRGWTGFLLDWSTNTYYLAVGHYGNRVQARFFGLAYREGYMVLAYSPSVPASWLPPMAGGQVGFYAGRMAGYEWDFEYTWGVVCDNKVWAYAHLGSESNFFIEFVPFALSADVYYWVNMGVGAQICGIGGEVSVAGDLGASVYVSQALGELSGTFSGRIRVCGPNNCWNLIKIPDINVNLTLWQA